MFKKIAFGTLAFAVTILSVPLFSAFEAHVINVTATIENALQIRPDAITFGTVFPQEQLDRVVSIGLSQSFLAQDRVGEVEYMIKQKPKCGLPLNTDPVTYSGFATVTEDANGNFVCPANYVALPLLCPYLSKHSSKATDTSINAFHGPLIGWTDAISDQFKAIGTLTNESPVTDWTIDLKVPCFAGMCAQDWDKFVTGINTNANPAEYIQPAGNEHKIFGCDLWFETTGISSGEELTVCEPTTEVLDGVDNNCNGLIDETLIFSEYVEGSSNNKVLEIYNPTGSSIDLSGYKIDKYVNGSSSATNLVTFPAVILAANDVYVICDDDSDVAILAQCDFQSGTTFYNGDDALALRKIAGDLVDVIGQIGFDPGTEWGSGVISTADNTIVRKCGIVNGDENGADAFDPATEWDGYAVDTFGNLGSHNPVCP